MQIRTALAIGSGIAIGVIFGMSVSEDTKCKILGKVRKNLIYALGGEEKKNYTTFRNPTYHKTYVSYSRPDYNQKYQGRQRVDIPDPKLLEFDDYESADKCVGQIENFIDAFNALSICDLAHMRERVLDYKWDVYGWTKEDFIGQEKCIYNVNGKYVLDIPRPKLIKT